MLANFSTSADTQVIPFLPHTEDDSGTGFIRATNQGAEDASVYARAYDDDGTELGESVFSIEPGATIHVTVEDLTQDSENENVTAGIELGDKGWWLALDGEAGIEAHAYARRTDGVSTPVQNLPHRFGSAIDAPNFVVGTAEEPFSKLRIVNPSNFGVVVSIFLKSSSTKRIPLESVSIGALGSTWVTGEVEETSDESAEGILAQERGTWDLEINWEFEALSNVRPVVLHLMQAPDGTFAHMPGRPQNKIGNKHSIPIFLNSKSDDSYSLLRIWNYSNISDVVNVVIRDDDGSEVGPLELTIDEVATVITLSELQRAAEESNAIWPEDDFIQIDITSDTELDVSTFFVQSNGLHAQLYDLAPRNRFETRVVYFETDSDDAIDSLLRINNPSSEDAHITIFGRDRAGTGTRDVSFSLKPFGARTIVETELTNGGVGIDGRLGSSSDDWQLHLLSDRHVTVMNLSRTMDGDLTNLSSAPYLIKKVYGASSVFQEHVSPSVVQSNCIGCHVVRGFAQNTRLVFVDSRISNHRERNRGSFAEFLSRVENGVAFVLDKVQGRRGHGGGVRMATDSNEFRELKRFLTLLAEEEGESSGICDRSTEIRNVLLTELDHDDCADVTANDLRSVGSLDTGTLSEIEADDLRGLTNLYRLTLCSVPEDTSATSSTLESLPPELLVHLPRLKELQISGCDIEEIPEGFFNDVTLSYLSINAPLTSLPELPKFTSTSRYQADLLLSNLELSELPSRGFAHTGLRYIEISNSESITDIAEFAFAGLQSLEVLSLIGTSMDSLSSGLFSYLHSLEELQLANNEIGNIPDDMEWPSKLTYLNLNQNPITRLSSGIFDGLVVLEDLRIEESGPLTNEISSDVFDALVSLESLQLANSGIDELPQGIFKNLANLKSIRLQDNNLSDLPDGIFDGLTALTSIELDGNSGEPFELLFELKRTDGALLGSSPGDIQLDSRLGFPFDGELGISVHNGTVSQESVTFSRGSTSSISIDVVQSDSSEATQVVLGPLIRASDTDTPGLEVAVDRPIVLFETTDNVMPMPLEKIKPRKLQIGASSWEYAFEQCFSDVDDETLTYSGVAGESGIVSIESSTNGVKLTPVAAGTTEITVSAADDSGLSVSQTFALVVEPAADQSSFQIDFDYIEVANERVRRLVSEASDRWEEIITDDVSDVPVIGSSNCVEATDIFTGDIDDLRLSVSVFTRPSNSAAFAWVSGIREESKLPYAGGLSLSANAIEEGTDEDVKRIILHELAHALGFTDSIWEEHDLIRNPSLIDGAGADTHFAGPRAIRAFDDAGGTGYTARSKVPLENSGVSNADSHWAFSELMDVAGTGALSAITIELFGDLGYVVDATKADEYTLPRHFTGNSAQHEIPTPRKLRYGTFFLLLPDEHTNDVIKVPLKIVNKHGQTVGVKHATSETNNRSSID